MSNGLLLWVDDEIELLKAHILFLEKKGYEVVTVSNGNDAIDQCRQKTFDLILLDEMMPGLSGLATLQHVKEIQPATPVVMVTKSEEEDIMNQAIGSKIADYLIKPVNPSQILLTLKKNIHQREIMTEVTQSGYQQNFQDISMQIDNCKDCQDWMDIYKRLVHWELELSSTDSSMTDMLRMQKEEANNGFARFIKKNYLDWLKPAARGPQDATSSREFPLLSPAVFKTKIFPLLDNKEKVFLIVIDNFRYDQWRVLAQEIGDMFDIDEQLYMSILPTATQYARNSIFSGLMPNKIAEMFPDLWVDEDEEEGKNLNEAPLIQTQLDRYRRKNTFSYHKINDSVGGDRFMAKKSAVTSRMQQHPSWQSISEREIGENSRLLYVGVTRAREILILAPKEKDNGITLSWFRHSVLADLFKQLAQDDYTVIITTDHGSIRADKPVKIIGDRNTNTNLRYKLGRNLSYNPKEVFVIKDPRSAFLPAPNLSTSYVFATGCSFFAYPNNYNYYVSYYKDTFQHGGISMEEMLIPLITMRGRKRA